MEESVQGAEPDESAEFEDLDDLPLDDLVVPGLEHDLLELDGLVDRAVTVDDATGSDRPDVLDQDGELLVVAKAALVGVPREFVYRTGDVLLEFGRRNAYDLLDLCEHVHG